MITVDQAKEYLAEMGVTLPDFMVALLVERANSINDCLDEHYDSGTAALIQLYLMGLFGMSQGGRYIASQSAPSGASRSFRYPSLAEGWRTVLGLLRSLDTHGCTDDLIPVDPTSAKGGVMSFSADC